MRLARFLQVKSKLPISSGQMKGSTLEQFQVFAKLNRWPLPREDTWQWAADLYQLRNTLVHEAGSVYVLSEAELENRTQKIQKIADRRPGLRVESVFEESTGPTSFES